MDKVYIDNNKKAVAVELPKYGEVSLMVKDGKVVKYDVISSYLLDEKGNQK
ncbi:hypothetical protein P7H46_03395 [Enterococcus pseudoavium]|uniref:Uncharacterized protein n=2 Tax=Enterococcus TaxID=1350 RepID=A0ABU3FFR7_9ENTE|nr:MULTISPECIES: hypothetical protein [Enterococcus]MDT2604702.1 hypothetical protein [Enterococcus dongliensis]MDT2760481.1 hypothetical protein [Enterococcus xiangfangensis]MDT2769883.1 hypothetical protein [Enterococcus pseudoavium]